MIDKESKRLILCAGLQSSGTTLVSWCFLQRLDTNGVLDMPHDTLQVSFEKVEEPIVWCKMTIGAFRWLDVYETYCDLGWQPEPLLVGWRAGPDRAEQGAPGVREAAPKPVKVKDQAQSWVEEPARSLVQCELARRWLLEDALAHQVSKYALEHGGVAAGLRGEGIDLVSASGDLVGDPQRRHDVDAPGCAEIAQGGKVRDGPVGHARAPH